MLSVLYTEFCLFCMPPECKLKFRLSEAYSLRIYALYTDPRLTPKFLRGRLLLFSND